MTDISHDLINKLPKYLQLKKNFTFFWKKPIKTKFMQIKTKKVTYNHCNLITHILIIIKVYA